MKNKLTDLNDHLFAQLERLSDESLDGEDLDKELRRSEAVAGVAREIIQTGRLVLRAQQLFSSGELGAAPAGMLAIEHKPNGK